MQILVRSDDKGLEPMLEEFALLFMREYENIMKSLKMRILRKAIREIPDIMPISIFEDKEKRGYVIDIPIDIPELEELRKVLNKLTGKKNDKVKWKENLCLNLSGYLKSKNVKFEKIEVIK